MQSPRCASPLCLAIVILAGCRTTSAPEAPGPSPEDRQALEGTLDRLYRAFCFDAGAEADWAGMESLFADGATFFPPIAPDSIPRGTDAEEFLDTFRTWVRDSDVGRTGLHERIVHLRVDAVGDIAHAFVTFDGFVPGRKPDRRGVDSIQLVRSGTEWRVASFTTHYAGEDSELPDRFAP